MNGLKRAAAFALCLLATPVTAEIKDVMLGQPLAKFDKLKQGTRLYIRYKEKDGIATPIDLQTKEVRFETQDGDKRLHIVQRWEGAGTWRQLDSWFEPGTFRPLTHQRDIFKDGQLTKEGFRFRADQVIGIADQPDNSQKDFAIASPQPTFNFETDLETLQTLPLAADTEFRIVFYHPGGKSPPAAYLFKVAGEEVLQSAVGPISCWLVTTDYNRPGGSLGQFWVAKDSQIVLRVESELPDGSKIIKALVS